MKKIALFHFTYPPNIGGVESVISEQADILSGMDHDVLVLTGSGKESNHKIKLLEIPQLKSVMGFNPLLQEKILQKGVIDDEFKKTAEDIGKILELRLADREIVIVHNMLTIIRNLPFIYAFKKFASSHSEKKLIIWVHDQTYIDGEKILEEEPGINIGGELKELLLTPIPLAKYVFISETFRNIFRKLVQIPEDQTRVIPNGINIKKFLEIDDFIWQIFVDKGLVKSFPVVLSPVNIIPRKNIEYSLEVVNCLKKYFPQIKYLVSGITSKHKDTSDYFSLISRKIESLGLGGNAVFLKEYMESGLLVSQIHDLYQMSDLVFYFSKSENFGLPVVEAFLTKSILFASNLKVFREIVPEDNFFVDCNLSPEENALKIKKFLDLNPQISMTSKMRQDYNLELIIKNKLIPLF